MKRFPRNEFPADVRQVNRAPVTYRPEAAVNTRTRMDDTRTGRLA
ncbi:Uncharacterised protein [Amycolatopsis camponoti]|uniref:Uncharacterized protein n=1 Tax=Amycolatopsis camponoti TaxID=2606593 RepID=A0A6I8LKV3_9PSEU|nr:Uncharacterised protein [Amycolatopsis camponoti]